MATEDNDIDLIIDDVSPDAEPQIEVKVDAQPPKEDLDAALEDMKAQLRDANAAREAAEERARAEAARSNASQRETVETQLALVANAIDTVKTQQATIKAQWAEAMAVGDFAMAADLQEQMSLNTQRLNVFEQGKQGLEQQAKAPPPKAVADDPVEALASSLTPKSASWVRAHPEFATDPRKYNQMIAAHELAIHKGIVAESDAYFAQIERTLEIGDAPPARNDTRHADAQADTARVSGGRQASAPPAAPPSRSSSTGGAAKATVRLSREEVEMAQMMGQTKEEYARNKAILQKQGRMN
jgi:hypothetical protein